MITHKTLLQLEAATQVKNLPPDVATSMMKHVVPDILSRFRELARDRLFDLLLSVSRKYWKLEEWSQGMEFTIWQALIEGAQTMTEDETAELREQADEAGGWFYRYGEDPGFNPDEVSDAEAKPQFVSMSRWEELYAARHNKTLSVEEQNRKLRIEIEKLRMENTLLRNPVNEEED